MGAPMQSLMSAFGIGQDGGAGKGMRRDLQSAKAGTTDFLHGPQWENDARLGKLVNTENYAPITGVADAAARQTRSQLSDMMARQATGSPGGYNPAAQRGAMNASARMGGQVGQQAITGRLQESMMNKQLGQGLDQVKLGLQNKFVDTQMDSAKTQSGMAQQAQQQQSAFGQNMLGTAMNVGGMLLSDEKAKKNVSSGNPAVEAALDRLNPVAYQYKDVNGMHIRYRPDGNGGMEVIAPEQMGADAPEVGEEVRSMFPGMPFTVRDFRTQQEQKADQERRASEYQIGEQNELANARYSRIGNHQLNHESMSVAPIPSDKKNIGVMAQDLEESGLQQAVLTNPQTGMKSIDVPQATGFNLAANANLHERLKRLEETGDMPGSDKHQLRKRGTMQRALRRR